MPKEPPDRSILLLYIQFFRHTSSLWITPLHSVTIGSMTYEFMSIIKKWFPFAFLAIALCFLVYLTEQQNLRQNANDPQIQMAEDTAAAVNAGREPQLLVPQGSVNIESSLMPYLVIYNASGTPVAGNGLLTGVLPLLPSGIFNYVQQKGEDRITWQPRSDVRSAIVVVQTNNENAKFIVAGRSLREVEIRIDRLTAITGTVLLFSLLGTLILAFFL
jgi:hypothetical protein